MSMPNLPNTQRRTRPVQQRSNETVTLFLAEAGRVIDRDGVDKLGMVELALSVGRAPAAMYRYFANKSQLINGVRVANTERLLMWIDLALIDLELKADVTEAVMVETAMEGIKSAYRSLPGTLALGVDVGEVMVLLAKHHLPVGSSRRVEVVLTAGAALVAKAFSLGPVPERGEWLDAAEDVVKTMLVWFEHQEDEGAR